MTNNKILRSQLQIFTALVSGELLKLLGIVDLRILTQLINNMYEPEMWDRNFTAAITISLKKANSCKMQGSSHGQHHSMDSIIPWTASSHGQHHPMVSITQGSASPHG
jgi:hypothetical protein